MSIPERKDRLSSSGGDSSSEGDRFWQRMADCGAQEVTVGGRLLRRGDRVRLNPNPGGDILDRFLKGRTAVIEGVGEDDAGAAHVAVSLEDERWDLGGARHPASRFFFSDAEIELIEEQENLSKRPRVLVAGIGNIFFGDDGFGCAVAKRLLEGESLPGGRNEERSQP